MQDHLMSTQNWLSVAIAWKKCTIFYVNQTRFTLFWTHCYIMLEQFSLHIYNKSNWNKCNFAVRLMSYNIVHILYICFMQVLARGKYQCYLTSSIFHSYAINRIKTDLVQFMNHFTLKFWNMCLNSEELNRFNIF